MSFLIDSDTCSAYLRRPGALFARFVQHSGRLWISTITLSDLYTWAYKQDDPTKILEKVGDFCAMCRSFRSMQRVRWI